MKSGLLLLSLVAAVSSCHRKTDHSGKISFPSDTTVLVNKRFVAYDDSAVKGGLRFHLNAREELDSAWRSFRLDPVHSTSRDDLKWTATDKVLKRFFNRGIQLFLSDKTKGTILLITAGKAIYSAKEKEFIFSENVILSGSRGNVLHTDSLKWQRNRFLFTTASSIVLKNSKTELHGEGFEARETFDRYQVRSVSITMPAGKNE